MDGESDMETASEAERVRLWLRDVIDRTGLTPTALARRAGLAPSTLNKFLNDDRVDHCLSVTTVGKIARASGQPLPIPAPGATEGARTVPVVGYVGAGATIYPMDDHPMGGGLEEAEAPPGIEPGQIIAVRVQGDSMAPTLQDGWLIYYSRSIVGVPHDCLGQLCVIKVADEGPTYVKFLYQGGKTGHFDLVGSAAQVMKDVPVEWAARVRWIKPA